MNNSENESAVSQNLNTIQNNVERYLKGMKNADHPKDFLEAYENFFHYGIGMAICSYSLMSNDVGISPQVSHKFKKSMIEGYKTLLEKGDEIMLHEEASQELINELLDNRKTARKFLAKMKVLEPDKF